MRKRFFYLLIFVSFLFSTFLFFSNCSERAPQASSDRSESPAPDLSSEFIFPHPKNAKDPLIHGPWVSKLSVSACQKCHKIDSDKLESPPACHQCHMIPHPDNWVQEHGKKVLAEGKRNCVGCHSTENPEGTSRQIACATCHEGIYPHPKNVIELHGGWAKGEGKHICGFCHGKALDGGLSKISCTNSKCHTDFPHPPQWEDLHGEKGIEFGIAGCVLCHGMDYDGGKSGVSCKECHSEFPHTDPFWASLEGTPVHASRFIALSREGKENLCTDCHGENYDKPLGENGKCTGCHVNGILHRSIDGNAWGTGAGHGKYFSNANKSTDSEASCWRCHGTPTEFDPLQTKDSLASQSSCYRCHWVYPHKAWITPQNNIQGWVPVRTNDCGSRNWQNVNWGHVNFIFDSPLLVNPDGVRPRDIPVNDPMWSRTLENTCGGGEEGSCHQSGNRSYQTGQSSGACGQYCHNSSLAGRPLLPACEPPPAELQRPGPPTVLLTNPPNGDIEISVRTQEIRINFNEAMQPESISADGAITVGKVDDGIPLSSHVDCSYTEGCRDVTIRLSSPLQESTPYEIKITTSVKDYEGTPLAEETRSRFTTRVPDRRPITVIETDPQAGAENVNVYSNRITFTFNKPVVADSVVYGDAVSLFKMGVRSHVSGTSVSCTRSVYNQGRYLGCDRFSMTIPDSHCRERGEDRRKFSMYPDTEYAVVIGTNVQDPDRQHLVESYRWTFQTENYWEE